MSQVWAMKLTESINICYISVRVAHTINVNIKEIFTGNTGFLQETMVSYKCLFCEWTAFRK